MEEMMGLLEQYRNRRKKHSETRDNSAANDPIVNNPALYVYPIFDTPERTPHHQSSSNDTPHTSYDGGLNHHSSGNDGGHSAGGNDGGSSSSDGGGGGGGD